MTIQRRRGGWDVVHCHGKDKGKSLGHHKTRKEALAQHRAIEISKKRRRENPTPEMTSEARAKIHAMKGMS